MKKYLMNFIPGVLVDGRHGFTVMFDHDDLIRQMCENNSLVIKISRGRSMIVPLSSIAMLVEQDVVSFEKVTEGLTNDADYLS